MLRRLLSFLRPGQASKSRAGRLITLEPDRVEFLLTRREGQVVVDWEMAEAWVNTNYADAADHPHVLRAIAAAWLDALQRESRADLHRWRHAVVEGLAPIDDGISRRVAAAGDKSALIVGEAMSKITGARSVEPVCIIASATTEDYYTFIAPYYPSEGEFATSGGVYINQRGPGLAFLALPVQGQRRNIEQVIAHEMTHHALYRLRLPLWVEEGLTQMMEERVTGSAPVALTPQLIERHRAHWDPDHLAAFWRGESFHSAAGEAQELSYSLADAIVRTQLSDRSTLFLRFIRAAAGDSTGETAAQQVLGKSLESLAGKLVATDDD